MKLGGTEKMPPKNNDFSELRGVAEVIEKMGMLSSFVGLVRRHNGMQLRLRTARTLLEKLSSVCSFCAQGPYNCSAVVGAQVIDGLWKPA